MKVENSQRYLVLEANIYRLVGGGGRGAESLEAELAQVWGVNVWQWHARTQVTGVRGRTPQQRSLPLFKNKRANPTWDPGRKGRAAGHRPQRIHNEEQKSQSMTTSNNSYYQEVFECLRQGALVSESQQKKKKKNLNCLQMVIFSISPDETTCILSLQVSCLRKQSPISVVPLPKIVCPEPSQNETIRKIQTVRCFTRQLALTL